MALHIDVDALIAEIAPDLVAAADELVAKGEVGPVRSEHGAAAVVAGLDAWAGVVDGQMAGECSCPDALPDDLTCVHTVALVMVAGAGFDWSSTLIEPEPVPFDPECLRAAEALEPARLARFVAEQGAADRVFAARLLSEADMLAEPGPADLRAARVTIAELCEVTQGRRWEMPDVVVAGRELMTQMELFALRPATADQLDVVEEAIATWARESQHLRDDWRRYGDDAEEIAAELVRIHIRVCLRLDLDPHDLADRLAELVAADSYGALAGLGTDHADLLGPDGLIAFEEQRDAHQGW
jgi:hypothetical protein